MKLPAKKRHSKKTSRLPLLLLLAVVVTMAGTTGTLAKYASSFSGQLSVEIAAFAGGGSMDFDLPLEDMYPGITRTTKFTVRNFESGQDCQVNMDYEIKIETMGNLPLEFTLRPAPENETGNGYNALAENRTETDGGTAGKTILFSGGKLPYVGEESDKTEHTYQLQVTWPEAKNSSVFSNEVDFVTVTVTAEQAALDSGGSPGVENSGDESSGEESSGDESSDEESPGSESSGEENSSGEDSGE